MRNVLAAVGTALVAGSAVAQETVHVVYPRPTLDRWMYPFNSQPGNEVSAPVFGAILTPGFDDRDAQFLVGFDTGADVPTGLQLSRYSVVSVRLVLRVSVDQQAVYDPSLDSVKSLYPVSDPEHVADSDPGRPMELFAVGYRNGWNSASFVENSPFGGAPIVPPAERSRNVFAAVVGDCAEAVDVSRQVRLRFDAAPLAVGACPSVNAGEPIPQGAEVVFDLDLSNPDAVAYVQRALFEGRLRMVVSSLEPATGGPGGGTGSPAYPAFYTKENAVSEPLGYSARLELGLDVFAAADFNRDGFVDGIDYDQFNNAFEAGQASADFNNDCFVDGIDYDQFNNAFEG